jgi:hypothetical protein
MAKLVIAAFAEASVARLGLTDHRQAPGRADLPIATNKLGSCC